jgi:LPXTG-site transpeptidase (sortase) family protein
MAAVRHQGRSGSSWLALGITLFMAAFAVFLRLSRASEVQSSHGPSVLGRLSGVLGDEPSSSGSSDPDREPGRAPNERTAAHVVDHLLGKSTPQRVGTLVTVLGGVLLVYTVGTYLELTPGSRVMIPDPPALSRTLPALTVEAVAVDPAVASDSSVPVSKSTPAPLVIAGANPTSAARSSREVAGNEPTPASDQGAAPAQRSAVATPGRATRSPTPRPAATKDPSLAGLSKPGLPVSLRIERLGIETEVVQAGIVEDAQGNEVWETVPFVAAHYRATGLVGTRGNPVISGHVVTLYEGNVFSNLFQVDFGDRIEVSTENGGKFLYRVADIKLVNPTDIHVMAPTPDASLTLITCGGEFDRLTQSFSKRLVVVAKLSRS